MGSVPPKRTAAPRPSTPESAEYETVAEALPNYDITGELGRGGWGVVLSGTHRRLGRDVAIKQLPPAFGKDPEVRARFTAEAKVLASLDHPHIVPIYDYVEHEGLCLLVMENLPGGTVWSRFAKKGLTMPQACGIALATCAGLHAAHEKGILHRDVKPENLMFSSTGTLKVTDFGIARMLGGGSTLATRAGEVLGTPAYMAPEQIRNGDLAPATDVYAAGVMLYELLSGRLPYSDEGDPVAVLFSHVYDEPEPLTEAAPSAPPDLAEVVMKAMERAPEDRFASAEDFGTAIADGAVEAWGAGWLTAAGVPVMASGRMAAVTEMAPAAGQTITPTRATGPPTKARRSTGAASATAAPGTAVRPTIAGHAGMAIASQLRAAELVPVSQVVRRARAPVVEFAAALVLLVLAVGAGFATLGSPSHAGDIPRSTMSVAGVDPASGQVVHVNLDKPVVVAGILPPQAATADQVRLSFKAGDIPLSKATARITPTPDRRFSVSFNVSGGKYLVAGRATAEVQLRAGQSVQAHRSFAVKSDQSPLATIPGAVTIASLLFLASYPRATLRSLRRGRRKVAGSLGLVFVGAVFGLAALIGAWLISSKEPVVPTAVACAALGAAAGAAAALGGRQLGLRRRPLVLAAVRE